jgi:hypothetical protein
MVQYTGSSGVCTEIGSVFRRKLSAKSDCLMNVGGNWHRMRDGRDTSVLEGKRNNRKYLF